MSKARSKIEWNRRSLAVRDARNSQPPVDIDMNPMVDMAFLLLTFFMLATTFSLPQTMEILMPPKPKVEDLAQEQPIKESKALSIILATDNQVYWYRGISEPELHQTNYGEDGLLKLLLELNQEVSGLVVLLKPMDNCRYENLVDALDDLTISKTERYALVKPSADDMTLLAGQANGTTIQNKTNPAEQQHGNALSWKAPQ